MRGGGDIERLKIIDANEIIDKQKIFLDDRGAVGIAAFSDYFRYHLLKYNGHYWVDMDVICIKNFDFKEDFVFAMQRNEKALPQQQATTCVIKAPKESDFIITLLLECDKILNDPVNILGYVNGMKKVKWGIIGPSLLDRIINQKHLQKFLKKPEYFCYINYFEAKNFIKPRAGKSIMQNKEIYGMHIWNAVWVDFNQKIDKNSFYDKDSVIEILKNKYIANYKNDKIVSDFAWYIQELSLVISQKTANYYNKIKESMKKRIKKYVKVR